MVLSWALASSSAVVFSFRDSAASLATTCAASLFFSKALICALRTAFSLFNSSMARSALLSFRRRPASTAATASSRMTGSGSATSAPSDLNFIFDRAWRRASRPASKPRRSSRSAFKEACRASERVRTVESDWMKPEIVKPSTVPDLADTMVPAGKRRSFTLRFPSVRASMASCSLSQEGAQSATGTPFERMRDAALLPEPD